jgi:hypothetical protein
MTVEFFNSSGNQPQPEYAKWLDKVRDELSNLDGVNPTIIKVCKWRHQHSRSECGVYALFYIYARLRGVPPSFFQDAPVPDQYMFEFRRHLYAHSAAFSDRAVSSSTVTQIGKASTDLTDWSWDDFVEKNSTEWDEDGGE